MNVTDLIMTAECFICTERRMEMRRSVPGQKDRRTLADEIKSVKREIAVAARRKHGVTDHGLVPSASGLGQTKKTHSCIAEILDRVRHGETITKICKDPHMPNYKTFWLWVTKDPELREQYHIAKQDQMDFFAEQILDIADDSATDIIESYDKNGRKVPIVNYENIKRSELRIRARQWLMERVRRERYNEKLFVAKQETETQNQTGPVKATIEIVLPDNGRQVLDVTPQQIMHKPLPL